jgi:hypothetical protein
VIVGLGSVVVEPGGEEVVQHRAAVTGTSSNLGPRRERAFENDPEVPVPTHRPPLPWVAMLPNARAMVVGKHGHRTFVECRR